MSESSAKSVSPLIRWGSLAAMLTGGLLLVKVAVAYATYPAESLLIASLYITGMLLPLFAAAGVAAHVGRNKGRAARFGIYLLIVVGFIMYITTLSEAVEAAFLAVTGSPEYIAIEIPIALAGVAWLFAGHRIWTKTEEGRRATAPKIA
jgi:hypothetical protein